MEMETGTSSVNAEPSIPKLGEALWFAAITVSLNNLVFFLCGILELVERYDLFKESRIQVKVQTIIL